jgi:hypothetical protein
MRSEIEIGGRLYRAKITLRSYMAYEEIMNEPFSPTKTINTLVFLYCVLLANNDDIPEWNEFLAILDEDPKLTESLADWLTKQDELGGLRENPESGDDKKKTRSRRKSCTLS